MAEEQYLNPHSDTLIRFLLPEARTRGTIIRGTHITADAARIHQLNADEAVVFGQTLLASILLLSISKGGMRQVLQLDNTKTDSTSWQRVLAETRPGSVRGYILRNEARQAATGTTAGDHIGSQLRLSTVRDLGFGTPYISTVEHDSPYLADHLTRYLTQSVQIRADIILLGDLAIMIEAMPGCEEEHWFNAVKTMAKIPDAALAHQTAEQLLGYFETLRCKPVGHDSYAYQCDCNPEQMLGLIRKMPGEQLDKMMDASGQVTVTCQYCGNHYGIPHHVDASRLQ
ncbi:MAG: Hsp33 family molecular chaperone HslO [Mariprofundus sp.]